MASTEDVAAPRGLFDRSTKGLSFDPVTVQVERDRVRFFAQVLGASDPIHFDVVAAQAEGHHDLVAPPSFFMVIESMARDESQRAGHVSPLERIGCDFRYLLHGDEQYDYRGLIYAGDVLKLTTTVVDFYEKKGGALEFATLRSVVEHEVRGVLVNATRTMLHKFG